MPRLSNRRPFYWKPRKGWYIKWRNRNVMLAHDPEPLLDEAGKPIPPPEATAAFLKFNLADDHRNGVPCRRSNVVPEELADIPHLQEFPRPRACIYFLVSDGKIVYVGKSLVIWHRVWQHMNGHKGNPPKVFDRVLYFTAPENQLDELEREFIRKLNPPLNFQCG